VPRLHEEPDELARLVGRDAAGNAMEDESHSAILPAVGDSRERALAP
jgi:hypothetical protein